MCDLKRTHLSVEHTLAGGKPCRRGTVFDVPREQRGVCAEGHTPERGTHARRGKSAVVELSLTCRENRDVCDLKVTHPSVEHTLAGGKPCRRGTVFDVLRE